MIQAVIWALDGVLVDSLPLRIKGLRHAAAQAGAELPDEADVRRWLCHGPRLALSNIPGANTSLRDFERYCRRIAREHIGNFEGLNSTLESLETEGLRQALVTSRIATDTDRWFALCNVPSALFDHRITYSDRLPSKPNPRGLLAAAGRPGISPSKCAYVGDTIEDGVACDRAGMPFLLAGWGTPDIAEVLLETTPTAVLERPHDMLTWIRADS